jgi:hypothetical protein
MKKILLAVFTLILTWPLAAQNTQVVKMNNQMENARSKIGQILEGAMLIDEFVLCQKVYDWDTIVNQFKLTGDGEIRYEELGGNKKRITILVNDFEEEEGFNIKVEAYFSFQDLDDFEDNVFGDSLLTFFGDGSGDYLLFNRELYYYENEKVIRSEGFTDYSLFGLPVGFIKSDETWYRYDNNGYLVEQVSDRFDFSTFELTFSDSIVYANNNQGKPVRETGYQASFFSQEIEPYYQTDYTYVNQLYVETQLEYSYSFGIWTRESRTSYTYDNMNRRTSSLTELTPDDGASWEPERRSTEEFNKDLPLPLPTSSLTQEYVNGAWRNFMLTTAEECTSGVEELADNSLVCWFNGDRLNLEGFAPGSGKISLYTLTGSRVLHQEYRVLPSSMLVSGLERGLYILHLQQDDRSYTRKLFR